ADAQRRKLLEFLQLLETAIRHSCPEKIHGRKLIEFSQTCACHVFAANKRYLREFLESLQLLEARVCHIVALGETQRGELFQSSQFLQAYIRDPGPVQIQ